MDAPEVKKRIICRFYTREPHTVFDAYETLEVGCPRFRTAIDLQ
jgi:hypothetical protein